MILEDILEDVPIVRVPENIEDVLLVPAVPARGVPAPVLATTAIATTGVTDVTTTVLPLAIVTTGVGGTIEGRSMRLRREIN